MIQSKKPLSKQVKEKVIKDKTEKPVVEKEGGDYGGNLKTMTSTGSTLLDLAISGGVTEFGGLPGGILVEIAGPNSSGKTVLLCEIGGYIQRNGGEAKFIDPEARINIQFSTIFGIDLDPKEIENPDTIPECFKPIRHWHPKKMNAVNGCLIDSLAALSTDLEMNNEDGDTMGMRRGKEFSQELRKTCRIIKNRNLLVVCSNQIRDRTMGGAAPTGGYAIGFYASVRLQTSKPEKIYREITFNGKKIKEPIGTCTEIEVTKNSTWKSYRKAKIYILSDYGIDDVRANLQFLKDYKDCAIYSIGERDLDKSIEKSIKIIEKENLEDELKAEVIELWRAIESKFDSPWRKPKKR